MKKKPIKMMAISYILGAVLLLNGCGKEEQHCDAMQTYHLHQVTKNYDDFQVSRWAVCNNIPYGYEKTDNVLPATLVDVELYNELTNKGLLNGQENIEFLYHQINTHRDYLEYYYYEEIVNPKYNDKGEFEGVDITVDEGWTTNKHHSNLTGKVRINHTRYYGYKIVLDNQTNKLKLINSHYVDDPRDIIDEYPYVGFSTTTTVQDTQNYSPGIVSFLDVEDITPFITPDKINIKSLSLHN